MRLNELDRKLEKLLAPIVRGEGFELVRVRLTGRQTRTLQVMAERPDRSMSADDCARLSRALSAALDVEDPIEGAYQLEVSSPGIDRPLVRASDFDAWRGCEARIDLDQPLDGRKRLKGVLEGTDGDMVRLRMDGAEGPARIPFARIASAKLLLTEELIRRTLKAAKAAGN